MSDQTPTSPKLVRDLMSVGVLTCTRETPLVELARVFLERELEAAVVLDLQGHGVGVVNRDDLIRAYGDASDPAGQDKILTAEDVMQDGIPRIPPDIPLKAAAQIMLDRGVRTLFLIHHAGGIEYPAAYISYKHLLRHMAMEKEEELRDLGVLAERELPLESYIKRRDESRRRGSTG